METNVTRTPNPQSTNKTEIKLDINGIKFDSKINGTSIKYTEICDYWNRDFPIRVLEIACPVELTFRILNMKVEECNGKPMYDINILSKPIMDRGVQIKTLNDGKFKAVLRQNDNENDFKDAFDARSRLYEHEQGGIKTELTFFLYREEELRFNMGGNINFITPNSTLSSLYLLGFTKGNPGLKTCVSKFDHNPSTGLFVVPPASFTDYVDLLDKEFGYFKTERMSFVEHNIFFLLNRDNDIRVSYPKLEYKLNILIPKSPKDRVDRFVKRLDERNFEISVEKNAVKIYRDSKSNFSNSIKYSYPNGKSELQDLGVGRNFDTVIKLTNVKPVDKLKNSEYEICELELQDSGLNFLTPLSTFSVMDAMGRRRIYRVCYKESRILSGVSNTMKLKGFRLLINE